MASTTWDKLVAEIPDHINQFTRQSLDVIDQIQLLRLRKGWSQKQLAEALGKKESEVSKWLSPGHNFTLKSLAKLESVLEGPILLTPVRQQTQEHSQQPGVVAGYPEHYERASETARAHARSLGQDQEFAEEREASELELLCT